MKVYEARLTEKETTSLSPSDVEDYMLVLKVNAYRVCVCVHIYHVQPSVFPSEEITGLFAFSFAPLHLERPVAAVQFETEGNEVKNTLVTVECVKFGCSPTGVSSQNMRAELDKKKDVLASMETELAKANHWNGQVVAPFHRCDMMLCKYTEQVSHLGDRWRRINGQIDTRHVGSSSLHV